MPTPPSTCQEPTDPLAGSDACEHNILQGFVTTDLMSGHILTAVILQDIESTDIVETNPVFSSDQDF